MWKEKQALKIIREADTILIGAGAGISSAAGLTYSEERFTSHFHEFIETYGKANMPDMYTAAFYPFPTEEAKWGYWSKHSMVNRFLPPALPLYQQLYELIKEKHYFVLTTNVDHQFHKAGFQPERIFATQGDYGEIQCARGCHPQVYNAEERFHKMDDARHNCLIPRSLVPRCPVCGAHMAMHLRCDRYFVEDENWHTASARYHSFLDTVQGKKIVLLELGVGFNTPGIIKYPFWQMTAENPNATYICINSKEAFCPNEIEGQSVCIGGNIEEFFDKLQ